MCVSAANAGDTNNAKDKSDLNSDYTVDMNDLVIFSRNYLQANMEQVEWCQFYADTVAGNEFEGRRTNYYKQHFSLLLSFINEGFRCGEDQFLLDLENDPVSPVRITRNWGGNGDYYVTDASVGSLFIYDADMVLKGEIKDLSKPLGVAVDSLGFILVGNNGRNNIEVYDPEDGVRLTAFGHNLVQMPTAIMLGPDNNIYITDSKLHRVLVFDAEYRHIKTIGRPGSADGELDFPIDTEVITNAHGDLEIYVADQGNQRINIYDGNGKYLRMIDDSIIPPPTPLPAPEFDNNGNACPAPCTGWFCGWLPPPPPECNPTTPRIEFSKLQALNSDSIGRLHTLDIYEALVSVFELENGQWVWKSYYGEYGEDVGKLFAPTDVLVSEPGQAHVVAGDGDRIEVLTTPQ